MGQSYLVSDVILCLGVVDTSGLASVNGHRVAGLKRLVSYLGIPAPCVCGVDEQKIRLSDRRRCERQVCRNEKIQEAI
jgi:hypothetical protein